MSPSFQETLLDRLNSLPLILAGPILRRVESEAVTVWVALKQPSLVTLRVYSTETGKGVKIDRLELKGSRSTVQLGKYLHLVAVTAESLTDFHLQPGQIYAYDLDFGETGGNLTQALQAQDKSANPTISYFEHQLPTFAMPPADLNHLQIVHGSCRKPHGEGRDALSILDGLIAKHHSNADRRPQQLFLTGDQIYADDVADSLLEAIDRIGSTLLGWEEDLSLQTSDEKAVQPGERSDLARDEGGFTAMLPDQSDKAKSHLFRLSEFCAMYLFAFSPVLWFWDFPTPVNLSESRKYCQRELAAIEGLASDLGLVRRALANVATYTIFDDHDVSDDWYLNQEWCERVLGKPLGRRVLQNAMLAYALFQAWGNTPDRFTNGQPGEKLLAAVQKWSMSAGSDRSAWEEIGKYLGIPQIDPDTDLPKFQLDEDVLVLDRDYPDRTPILDWHYSITSFKHEVIVLDTRTWRGYPNRGRERGREGERERNNFSPSGEDLPILLCPTAFKRQLREPLQATKNSEIEITLVVMPTNLESLWIIDLIQEWHLRQGEMFSTDVGDSWTLNRIGFAKLLAELFRQRDRIVVLSGDIHYASAVRINYWCHRHFGDDRSASDRVGDWQEKSQVLAQLTSSSFKNAEKKTYLINTKLKSLLPELTQDWMGWNQPPRLIEIQTIQETVRQIALTLPETGPIVRPLTGGRGNWQIAWEIALADRQSLPDWRYRIEWIDRELAREFNLPDEPAERLLVDWRLKDPSDRSSWGKKLFHLVSRLWRNRWFQEGKEAIGHNNLGLVSFAWPANSDETKAVIHDVYWRAPWQPEAIVSSRYLVSLRLDPPPPLPKVIG